jgi:hypothetical protein
MGIFRSGTAEDEAKLEQILKAIPFASDIEFSYDGKISPAYLLPVDSRRDEIFGLFLKEGTLIEVSFGFLQKYSFLQKNRYHLDMDGNLSKAKQNNEIIYLPLKLTEITLPIGHNKNGKFTPLDGSPFPIYGVEGSNYLYPLICVTETEKGIQSRGIYKNSKGDVLTYTNNGMKKEIGQFLQGLADGKLDCSND